MLLNSGYTLSGEPRDQGRSVYVAHVFTPETAATTHYWFAIAFPKKMGEEGRRLAEENIQWLRQPFTTEDMPMLQAQQELIGDQDFWALKPILLASDGGAVRARRILEKMIKQERCRR